MGAYVATVISAELGKMVSKETKVDILVTPSVVIISGVLLAMFVGPGINAVQPMIVLVTMFILEIL